MTLSLKVTIAKVTRESQKDLFSFKDLKKQLLSDLNEGLTDKVRYYFNIMEDSYKIKGDFNEDKAASGKRERQCRELIYNFRN